MAGKLDNVPQPVREAIAIAIMVACVTSTAAALLNEPLFLLGGLLLFFVFYVWRLNPMIKAAYQAETERIEAEEYADDETYQPILDRFADDHDDAALVEGYREWDDADLHENDVRLRFLQEAILQMIDAGKIYRVEELMSEAEGAARAEGLTDRFEAFRADCDRRIAEIAQARLG